MSIQPRYDVMGMLAQCQIVQGSNAGAHRTALLEAALHLLALDIDLAEEVLVVLVAVQLAPHVLLEVRPQLGQRPRARAAQAVCQLRRLPNTSIMLVKSRSYILQF